MDQCPELGSPTSEAQASLPGRAPRPCQPHGSEEKGERRKKEKKERKKERKERKKKKARKKEGKEEREREGGKKE